MGTPLIAADVAAPAYRHPLDRPGAFDTVTSAVRRASGGLSGLADPFVVSDPSDGGWISADALVDGTALPLLLDGPTQLWGATTHAAAALAWKAYTYWLAVPAVLGLTCADRVPLLDAGNVVVRLSHDPPYLTLGIRRPAVAMLPGDPFAGEPGAVVVEDRAALLRVLATNLVDRHLAPLADATRARVRIGARVLSGSLAASVGYALRLAEDLPRPAADLLRQGREILDALRVTDLVELSESSGGSVEVHRNTCCLAFTVPGLAICAGCCIER